MADANKEYQRLKELGNDKFRIKDYKAAKELYSDAIKAKNDEPIAYINRAACNLGLRLFFDVVEDCDRAIELDATLFKAYYRRSVALIALSRLNLARADLIRASELDPSSVLVKSELTKLNSMFEQNARVDVKCYEKPERLQSKRGLQVFKLNNQYSGSRQYDLSQA